MMPKGWKQETLGGVTLESAFGPRFSSDLYDENGAVGTIRTTDLDEEGNIEYSNIPYANLDRSFESHYLEKNDLLITRSGSCGIPCIFEKQEKPIVAGAFLIRFKLNEKVEPKFLHALLKSEKLQKIIEKLASGGVQKNLSGTNLKKVQFLLPPLAEQKKITQILSTWDKAITTTEKLLANSQQQKNALMQKLFTGKKRLLDENGFRFKGEWKNCHLADAAKIVMGSSPKSEAYNDSGDGLPLLQGNADIKNRKSCPRIYTSEITKECAPGDILLSVRAPVGSVATSCHKACIGRGIAAIQALKNTNQNFLYHWLLWFEPQWCSLSQGSTFESINSDDIKTLKIQIPNLVEQNKIAALLSVSDQKIEALKLKFDHLKLEKKSLMQQLLTGKRRVNLGRGV